MFCAGQCFDSFTPFGSSQRRVAEACDTWLAMAMLTRILAGAVRAGLVIAAQLEKHPSIVRPTCQTYEHAPVVASSNAARLVAAVKKLMRTTIGVAGGVCSLERPKGTFERGRLGTKEGKHGFGCSTNTTRRTYRSSAHPPLSALGPAVVSRWLENASRQEDECLAASSVHNGPLKLERFSLSLRFTYFSFAGRRLGLFHVRCTGGLLLAQKN